jgi:uncharacterized membrane protein
MILLLCIYVSSGLFLALLAIPMIRGWLNPNPYYGFRVRQTLEDPAVWYLANRYAGWRLFFAGLVIASGSMGCYLLPQQSVDQFAYTCLGLITVALAWAIMSSFLFLNRLAAKTG